MCAGTKTPAASSGRQRGASLGVGQDAGRCRMESGPELRDELGAVLNDYQLDKRRGVEVESQRRCSETRSETAPRAFVCA